MQPTFNFTALLLARNCPRDVKKPFRSIYPRLDTRSHPLQSKDSENNAIAVWPFWNAYCEGKGRAPYDPSTQENGLGFYTDQAVLEKNCNALDWITINEFMEYMSRHPQVTDNYFRNMKMFLNTHAKCEFHSRALRLNALESCYYPNISVATSNKTSRICSVRIQKRSHADSIRECKELQALVHEGPTEQQVDKM